MMNLSNVQNDIKTKEFKNCYIFTGEESAVMKIYENMIIKNSGYEKVVIDSIINIYNKLKIKSFVYKPKVYVIFNDDEFTKAEKLWKPLINNELGFKDIIIFKYSSMDKRSKFYKKYKDEFVEFNELTSKVLGNYIQKQLDLSNHDAQGLAMLCDLNYNKILLEINKINNLSTSLKISNEKALERCLKYNLIHRTPEDAIFKLTDSICCGRISESFRLAEDYKKVEESSLPLITVLYNNFKAMLQVMTCNSKNIAEVTGLTGYQIKLAKEKIGAYSVIETVNAVNTLRKLEKGIKIGQYADSECVDYILVNIL